MTTNDYIFFWQDEPIPIGQNCVYPDGDYEHHGLVISCLWDESHIPPAYQIEMKTRFAIWDDQLVEEFKAGQHGSAEDFKE